jgi:peptidoglycan/xylan/chitin deacetylase (PgdA/CDA1 family)
MAGFRHTFIHFSQRLTALLPPARLMRWTGQRLFLPFYHAIADEPLPHIRHLYPVKGSRQFAQDLDFLLRYYEPLSITDFEDWQNGKITLRRPPLLLSFDDGLREFHDVIAPILLRKGIPAICFLNSAFVDNRGLFFRYKASLLLEALTQNGDWADDPSCLAWRKTQLPSAQNWRQALLGIRYHNRHLLDELAAKVSLDFGAFLQGQQPYLSSPQIRDLQTKGFVFGAHSVDHPEYRWLSTEEQLRQTVESLAFVQTQFGVERPCFSFPFTDFGVRSSFFTQLRAATDVRYTFGCAGQKQDSAPAHFQRTPFEDGSLSARRIHNAELLYYLLKAPFGKNRIRRHD